VPVAWSLGERRQSRDDAMFEVLRSRVDEVIALELVLIVGLIVLLPKVYICFARPMLKSELFHMRPDEMWWR
jgi:hypothetical protein